MNWRQAATAAFKPGAARMCGGHSAICGRTAAVVSAGTRRSCLQLVSLFLWARQLRSPQIHRAHVAFRASTAPACSLLSWQSIPCPPLCAALTFLVVQPHRTVHSAVHTPALLHLGWKPKCRMDLVAALAHFRKGNGLSSRGNCERLQGTAQCVRKRCARTPSCSAAQLEHHRLFLSAGIPALNGRPFKHSTGRRCWYSSKTYAHRRTVAGRSPRTSCRRSLNRRQ